MACRTNDRPTGWFVGLSSNLDAKKFANGDVLWPDLALTTT